ncbi:MAG: hypothetical protein ACI9UO_000001, partial [Nitrospinales bacterium]
MNMVVDLVTANFKNKILTAGAFCLLFCSFFVLPSFAQISPQGRDQVYKQASPLRFDERFKKQAKPKAQKIPVRKDNLKPMFPEELRKVKFVLRKMVIKGSTLY